MPDIRAIRYHDISCGHRVVGHESKCRGLHGHNYRITFECSMVQNELDSIGRVIDFSIIKELLCQWLEDSWDHRTLIWTRDPLAEWLANQPPSSDQEVRDALDAVTLVPFNPTAENMALHLLRVVGPQMLAGTGVTLVRVTVEETRKCSAIAAL